MLRATLRSLVLTAGLTACASVMTFGPAPSPAHAAPPCPTPLVADTVLTGDCEGSIVVAASDIQVNLAGFTVFGAGGTGFLLDGVSGVHLHSGTVTGFDIGVGLVNADGNHLNNLTITRNDDGIVLSNSHDNLINGSTILRNRGVGIRFIGSNDNSVRTVALIHNRGGAHQSGGIYLVDSNSNSISSVLALRNGEVGVLVQDSSNNELLGMTVSQTAESTGPGSGIKLAGDSDSNTVRGNTVEDNSDGIILTAGADFNLVQSNETAFNVNDGIAVGLGATGNELKSSDSHDNGGFDLSDGNPACDANIWKSNTFASANQGCIS